MHDLLIPTNSSTASLGPGATCSKRISGTSRSVARRSSLLRCRVHPTKAGEDWEDSNDIRKQEDPRAGRLLPVQCDPSRYLDIFVTDRATTTVFRSGFSEASMDDDIARSLNDNTDAAELESPYPSHEYDDSDDEEDDLFSYISDQPSLDGVTGTESGFSTPTHVEPSAAEFLADQKGLVESARPPDEDTEDVNPKPPRSCSPKSKEAPPPTPSRSTISPEKPLVPGPKKMRAVVQDVAYSTYKAVLYYVCKSPLVRSNAADDLVNSTPSRSTRISSFSHRSLHPLLRPRREKDKQR